MQPANITIFVSPPPSFGRALVLCTFILARASVKKTRIKAGKQGSRVLEELENRMGDQVVDAMDRTLGRIEEQLTTISQPVVNQFNYDKIPPRSKVEVKEDDFGLYVSDPDKTEPESEEYETGTDDKERTWEEHLAAEGKE